jgi:NAD(P)-dependent dehydrogenase (short-subunit alcohol dehydrogenase family)
MRDIQGQTVIVTGAASGIGLGIAKALPHAGANILLADLRAKPLKAAAFPARALPPEGVGRRVLQAVRDDEFYVLTHTEERDAVTKRLDRIKAAFDRADAVMPGIDRS